MSTPTAPDIAAIVRQVIAEITSGQQGPATNGRATPPSAAAQHRRGPEGSAAAPPSAGAGPGRPAAAHGICHTVNDAVAAAQTAFEQLEGAGVEGRRRAIAHIRRIAIDDAEELGRMEFAETKIGRLDHKIGKLKVLGEKVPGVEFMQSEVFSGDHGLAVIEHAPCGVIAAIGPNGACSITARPW
ncbi:MAG: hypothetical protein ACKO1M_05420, partial [Planctomycetota bacterium]